MPVPSEFRAAPDPVPVPSEFRATPDPVPVPVPSRIPAAPQPASTALGPVPDPASTALGPVPDSAPTALGPVPDSAPTALGPVPNPAPAPVPDPARGPAPVPPEILAALARTRPLPAVSAVLRGALHARRMLLLKSLLVRVDRARGALPAAVRRRFEDDWTLLERAERTDATAVRAVLDYPTTGAWLAAALAAPDGPDFADGLAGLGALAVAAALRAGCRFRTTRTLPAGTLPLPGIGLLRCARGPVRLSGRAGALRITDGSGRTLLLPGPAPAGPGTRWSADGALAWSALHPLPGGTAVLDDVDPHRVPAGGIGPAALPAAERPYADPAAWAARWRDAHALLAATHPARAAETLALVRAVVPLAPPVGGAPPVSATVRTAPGAVLAQLPADRRELAELLVHETHHTKLAVLDESVPLWRPGGSLHRVGWRRDPRPVPGVLQGAYAHLALLDLWGRARTGPARSWRRRAAERFEVCREQVAEALSVLAESDELTPCGREFVRHMGSRHARLGTAAHPPG
ncbi:aKG-HExxH-type peptide beta-hydroxylase [Streptomyces tricolor]|uniref:aKG-HExxH-type peptide beta-hydroxylase n=1 Tax=Streptomyces tricolor TaxID=68277 RepID=UPI0037F57949